MDPELVSNLAEVLVSLIGDEEDPIENTMWEHIDKKLQPVFGKRWNAFICCANPEREGLQDVYVAYTTLRAELLTVILIQAALQVAKKGWEVLRK